MLSAGLPVPCVADEVGTNGVERIKESANARCVGIMDHIIDVWRQIANFEDEGF